MEKPAACLLTKNSSVFVFPFLSFPFVSSQTLNRNDAVDVTFSLKGLYDDTKAFLDENLVSGGGWNKGGQRIPSEDGHDRSAHQLVLSAGDTSVLTMRRYQVFSQELMTKRINVG